MEDSALVDAVDLFQGDALHLRVGLLADVKLLRPGTEFTCAEVGDDGGGRLADFAMGQNDGGRDVVGEFQVLGKDAGAAGGFGRGGEVGELVVFVAGGIALEGAGFKPFQGGRAVPEALVVGVEGVALGVEADAAGGAYAGAGGDHFPVWGDADSPAAPVGSRAT